jgi:hypothetical protein
MEKVERRLAKVKVKRKDTISEVEVNYEIFNDKDGWLLVTHKCKEEPKQELEELLDQFLPILISTVGLNEQWEDEGVIIGVGVKYLDDQIGINVTGKCDIDGRAACPTSPFYILPDHMESKLLKPLEIAVFKYLEGDRRQQSLSLN